MTLTRAVLMRGLAEEILGESEAADAKHGTNLDVPDGTNAFGDAATERSARLRCEAAFTNGYGTWRHILDEEIAEAYAAATPDALRAELVQVASVAQRWIAALDARQDTER